MHNLKTVIKFEILKQVRKPLFWVAVFAFPALMLIFGGVSYIGGVMAEKQDDVAKEEVKNQLESLIVVDHSKLVSAEMFGKLKVKTMTDDNEALREFKANNNTKQALIIYPENIEKGKIKTYTKFTEEGGATQQITTGVNSLAQTVLSASASAKVDPKIATILKAQNLEVENQILDQNGKLYQPFKKMILPGICLAIYFFIFMTTTNQTLVATTEEKENRIAEMILTTTSAKSLIVGKIIALVAIGLIQTVALLTPMLIIYFVGTKLFNMPEVLSTMLSGAEVEFWPLFFGIALLLFGFLLMTGSIILVGSLFPTAQDATQFYTPIVLMMIIPLYFASAIFAGVQNLAITFFSFFPLSAPLTLLMRNTAGNLSIAEGIIGVIIVVVSGGLMMLLAVRVFQRSVFEYSKPSSFKEVLARAKK